MVEKGMVIYNFASHQTARQHISYLADKIDGVSYDLELWEKSKNEGQNISSSSQTMSEIINEYELYYHGGLSYQLAKNPNAIEDMAVYMDLYGPHSHGLLKSDPDGYVEFLRDQAERARSVNPDIVIEIMVSTGDGTPSVEKTYEIIESCLDFTDRVMIYHTNTEESYQKTQELIHLMRANPDE